MDTEGARSTPVYRDPDDDTWHKVGAVLVAGAGGVLLWWYVTGIASAVTGDIRDFPPVYRANPVLAVVVACLKAGAYVLFPLLPLFLIYAPVRNHILRRAVAGKLAGFEVRVGLRGKSHLVVRVAERNIRVRDGEGLRSVLNDLCGREVRLTLGAFHRAMAVDRLDQGGG